MLPERKQNVSGLLRMQPSSGNCSFRGMRSLRPKSLKADSVFIRPPFKSRNSSESLMFEPYRKFPSMNDVAVLVCARGPANVIEGWFFMTLSIATKFQYINSL
jgi:hypothetical protein